MFCPNCGTPVSNQANSCPNCRENLVGINNLAPDRRVGDSKKAVDSFVAVLIIILILAVMIVIFAGASR